jgi:hypothetical protein
MAISGLLPEQGKDFCDRHHALELCRSVAGPLRSVDNSFNGLSGLGRASFDPTSYVAEHQPERGRIMAKGKKRAKVQKRGKLPKGKTASRGKARKVAKAAKRTVARTKQPVTPVVETVAVEMSRKSRRHAERAEPEALPVETKEAAN